jgi:hypothetical protein
MAILTAPQIWRRAPATTTAGRALGRRLTPAECENVRLALRFLCFRYPTNAVASAAIDISYDAIRKARSRTRPHTYRLACLVAGAAGVDVQRILGGAWPGDRCPHCAGTSKRSQVVRGAK